MWAPAANSFAYDRLSVVLSTSASYLTSGTWCGRMIALVQAATTAQPVTVLCPTQTNIGYVTIARDVPGALSETLVVDEVLVQRAGGHPMGR